MFQYSVRRLLALIVLLFGISNVVFLMLHLIPGDVAEIAFGTQYGDSPEAVEAFRRLYGLDQPIHKQYLTWLSNAMHGNLGYSIRTGRRILPDILSYLGVTVELAIGAAVTSIVLGIPLGIVSSCRQGTYVDFFLQVLGLMGLSLPSFWWGTMMILICSKLLHWLPSPQYVHFFEDPIGALSILFMPAIALGTAMTAVIMRMTRSSMLETFRKEYIQTARAKGLSEGVVLYKHAFRNAAIPVITMSGMQIGYLMGGAVLVESVFALPGLGRFIVTAVSQRDYPVIQASILCVALLFCVINLCTDLLYALINPEIRFE